MMDPVKPVLVTGAPRSGTTWVGRMLAASPDLYYIHEPFNPDFPPGSGVCNVKFTHHQTYITGENEKSYLRPIRHMIQGKFNMPAAMLSCRSMVDMRKALSLRSEWENYEREGMRPLVKDPIAFMSAGWLARRFDMEVVLMIRHPAAFVASMKRLDWGFDPDSWALSQELLLRDYLSPLETELKALRDNPADLIEQNALCWKAIYHVVLQYQKQYPDWIYIKHEEIANDPMARYQALYDRLGIHFTAKVKARIDEFSSDANPPFSTGSEKLLKLNSKSVSSQWKNALSEEEVSRIREIVHDVSDHFYSDSDWALDTP